MGYFFSLSAEFGSNQIDAKNFAEHFNQLSFILSNGQQFNCRAGFQLDEGGVRGQNYWCIVSPIKANGKEINVFEDCQEMNELAALLYERLQSAPTFRYAIIGVEVDEFLRYEELISDERINEHLTTWGLIISQDIWEKLGSNQVFIEFKSGYLWIPFRPLSDWIYIKE